jgi:hypothetical protein
MIWTSLFIVVTYIAACTALGFVIQIFVWIKQRND